MYIYICMYIYIHTQIHIYIYTYKYTCICIYTYMHLYIHTQHILTQQVSVLAKEAKKPFYVAAESYKFCRLYPLR